MKGKDFRDEYKVTRFFFLRPFCTITVFFKMAQIEVSPSGKISSTTIFFLFQIWRQNPVNRFYLNFKSARHSLLYVSTVSLRFLSPGMDRSREYSRVYTHPRSTSMEPSSELHQCCSCWFASNVFRLGCCSRDSRKYWNRTRGGTDGTLGTSDISHRQTSIGYRRIRRCRRTKNYQNGPAKPTF